MQIVTYQELKDKTDVFVLWAKSFGWFCTSRQMDHWDKKDLRIKGTPVGFCGIIDGLLAGFVGVMKIPTRNRHGEIETIGGIWAVSTRPRFARQGVGGHLLEAAENYFREQKLRLSMLTTSRSLISHRGYFSFGYREIESVNLQPHFYKVPRRSPALDPFATPPKGKTKRDFLERIGEQWERYTQGHCGFVIRDVELMKQREQLGYFEPGISILMDNGYLLASRQLGSMIIPEIVAFDKKTARELIQRAGAFATAGLYLRNVFDPEIAALLSKSGFREDPGSYGVLMVKSLDGTTFNDVYDQTFLWSNVDGF
jgi:GNAT superfamily N-acetyltransferase